MSARKITPAMLRKAGACEKDYRAFEAEWPTGVVPTLAVCRRALALNFDLEWAAENLLAKVRRRAYNEAMDPADRAYSEAMAAPRRALNESWGAGRSAAYRACVEATEQTDRAHGEATAVAFAAAWASEPREVLP